MKLEKLFKCGAMAFFAIALGSGARASLISGSIDFAGPVTLDGPLGTATKVNTFTAPRVSNASGDFDAYITSQNEGPLYIGDLVTITSPWTFNSGNVIPFWKVGGFTFDLTGSAVIMQSGSFLDVRGTGVAYGNGFDPTDGIWQFNMTSTSSSFSFQSSTSVPDGGTTLAMLGISLLGIHGLRHKFGKR